MPDPRGNRLKVDTLLDCVAHEEMPEAMMIIVGLVVASGIGNQGLNAGSK